MLNKSGVTGRLLDFARVISGWMIGGLAQINVLWRVCWGVSGSATADAAMQARVLGLPMVARGYPKAFSAVVIAFGSLITATIPPSILMILYGFVGNVSIGKLFVAVFSPIIANSNIDADELYACPENEYQARDSLTAMSAGSMAQF